MEEHIRQYHDQYRKHLRSSLYKENTSRNKVSINKKYSSAYYNKKSKIFDGDKHAIMYWRYLNSLQDDFYDFQEEILKQFFQISLPQLYDGESWRQNDKQILQMYGYPTVPFKYQLYEAARKEGKTFIASAHVAAAMLAIPPRKETFIIALVSLTLKNATDILAKVYSIMSSMKYDRNRIKIVYQIEKIKVEFYDSNGQYIGTNLIEPKQSGGVNIFILFCRFCVLYVCIDCDVLSKGTIRTNIGQYTIKFYFFLLFLNSFANHSNPFFIPLSLYTSVANISYDIFNLFNPNFSLIVSTETASSMSCLFANTASMPSSFFQS
jgi:hypothetical protein